MTSLAGRAIFLVLVFAGVCTLAVGGFPPAPWGIPTVAAVALMVGTRLGELSASLACRCRAEDLQGSFAGWGRAVEEIEKLAREFERGRSEEE
jgi:hypothetical protein